MVLDDNLPAQVEKNSMKCKEMFGALVKEVSTGKSNVLVNSRAVTNYLQPNAKIYKDAKNLLDEYVRIVLKLAYSQITETKEMAIRTGHIEKAFTRAALLVSLDNGKIMWEITKR